MEGVYLQSEEFKMKISQLASGIIILNTESDIKTTKMGTALDFTVTNSWWNGIYISFKFRAESVVEVEKWVFHIQKLLTQRFQQDKDLKTNSQRYGKGSEHFAKSFTEETLESNKVPMHGFFHKLSLSKKEKQSSNQYECSDIFKEQCRSIEI